MSCGKPERGGHASPQAGVAVDHEAKMLLPCLARDSTDGRGVVSEREWLIFRSVSRLSLVPPFVSYLPVIPARHAQLLQREDIPRT
jgi:hypothetical protein